MGRRAWIPLGLVTLGVGAVTIILATSGSAPRSTSQRVRRSAEAADARLAGLPAHPHPRVVAPPDAEVRGGLAAVESLNAPIADDRGFVVPIQPLSIAQAPAGWSQDQGVDVSPAGGACGPAATEVAMTAGTIVIATSVAA